MLPIIPIIVAGAAISAAIAKYKSSLDEVQNVPHDVSDQEVETFWQAVIARDCNTVKSMLAAGGDVNSRFMNQLSALHMAVNFEDKKLVGILVDAGADVNAMDEHALTPMFYCKNIACAKILYEHGALLEALDDNGRSPLFYIQNSDLILWMLKNGAEVNRSDKNGMTPLSCASTPDVVDVLVNNGAAVDWRDGNGRTLLFYIRDEKVLHALVMYGVSMLAEDNQNLLAIEVNSALFSEDLTSLLDQVVKDPLFGHRHPILWPYVAKINLSSLKSIEPVEGYKAEYCYNNGTSMLLGAVRYNNFSDAEILVSHGADCDVVDQCGRTPLFYAQTVEIVRLLVDNGANVNHRDKNGQTPLFWANKETISELIARGANIHAVDSNGHTALAYARDAECVYALANSESAVTCTSASLNVLSSSSAAMALLNRYGRDLIGKVDDIQSVEVRSAVQYYKDFIRNAVDFNTFSVDDLASMDPDKRSMMRNAMGENVLMHLMKFYNVCNLDWNEQDFRVKNVLGQSPLFYAPNEDCIKWLVRIHKCDVNETDCNGQTPLFFSCALSCAKRLINLGADMTLDNTGRSPLFYAQTMEIVNGLVKLQGRLGHVDIYGRTPLFYAKTVDVAMGLVNCGCDPMKVDIDGKCAFEYVREPAVVGYLERFNQ